MKPWIKWIIGAGILLGIGGFIAWRVLAGNIKTPIRTVHVGYETITKDVAFTATVAAKQSSTFSFELTGSIQALYANVGDTVIKGQRLAKVKAAKSILRAPFDGIVTKRSIEIGELATAGKELFTVETTANVELTADVPETDALVLATATEADATFDALPSQQKVPTTVASIDPAAVVIQGVPTFKITLPLVNAPANLRPGLTANVIVHVATKEHVLGVPRRAIITKSGKEFVKIQHADKSEKEVQVTTGLVGSDGIVEITSGLMDEDSIVTP